MHQTHSKADVVADGVIFSAGTLRYTKTGLLLLFFFLLWNDLALWLMEQVAPQLVPLLLKDHGASNWDIAFYCSTLTSLLMLVINPTVSTLSDRHRGPYGRRRPFLLSATPFCALFLAAIAFMPALANKIVKWPLIIAIFHQSTFNLAVILIGMCSVAFSIFNSVLLTLFTYYFWDVVPEAVLARFMALTKIASIGAVFLFNYYVFGYSAHHERMVFIGIAGFFLVVYMMTLWRVKEYPPVAEASHPHRNWIQGIRDYFVECFGESYYRWIYAASALYQIGNLSNLYQIFYFRNELMLDLDTVGKMRSWPTLILIFVGYFAGSMIDHFKPMRMIVPLMVLFAMSNLLAFFFLHGRWSLMFFSGLIGLVVFVLNVCQGVLWVDLYPREKLGQFCSANQVSQTAVCLVVALLVGGFFDWVKSYRYAFLWSAGFELLSAAMFWKVLIMWRARQGNVGQADPILKSLQNGNDPRNTPVAHPDETPCAKMTPSSSR